MADRFGKDIGAEDAAMPAEVERWLRSVLAEVQLATSAVAADDVARFDEALLKARRVYVAGQGRSGLVARAFAQRLMHIGFESYAVGDIITPAVGAADVFVAVTASGRTETTVSQAANAKAAGATIVTLTEMESGELVGLSELRLLVPTRPPSGPKSEQHATTLFCQTVQILFDVVCAMLQQQLHQTDAQLSARHSNLE
jgi:6-phospho-3-hexuloisomerase